MLEILKIIKKFNKEVKAILFTNFLLSIGSSLFFLLFNLYLKEINFRESEIGIILATRIFSSSAFLIISHFKSFNLVSLYRKLPFLFFISIIIQGTSSSIYLILLGSIIMGISWGIMGYASVPLIARKTHKERRPYAFSFNFALTLFSSMIGNLGGGFLKKFFQTFFNPALSYNLTFITGSFFALISYFTLKCLRSEEAIEEAILEEKEKKESKMGFLILIPQVLIGLGAGMFVPYMNLYFKNIFRSEADTIGVIFSITNFFMFVFSLIAPFLTRIFKKIEILILTQLSSIPFMIALALSKNFYLSSFSHIIRTSLMNMAQPLLSNAAMESVSIQYQKILNASIILSWNISFAISNLIGGYLIEKKGFTLPILISTFLYLLSTIFYEFLRKKEPFKNI